MFKRLASLVIALAPCVTSGCVLRSGEPAVDPGEPVATTPTEPVIEVTSAARSHLEGYARQNGLGSAWMVRLTVKPGGCTGMTNLLDLDTGSPGRDDATVRSEGVTCVYARDQYPLIQGARIDYGTENGKSGFIITFPHQTPENRARAAEWLKAAFPNSGLILDPAPAVAPTPTADQTAEQP